MIITFINIIVLIMVLLVMYVTYQNRLLVVQKTNEFVLLVDEARAVQDELEQLLDKVIDVSGNMVDNLAAEQQRSLEKVGLENQLLREIRPESEPDITAASLKEDIKAENAQEKDSITIPENEVPPQVSPSKTTPNFDLQNFHIMVKNLYQRGLTTKEIAQKLDKGQDEVSLIINLLDMQYMSS